MATRKNWGEIIVRAAAIAADYQTQVTSRQLYYRLVAEGAIRNTRSDYSTLTRTTAAARRNGDFPRLLDAGRQVRRQASWASAEDCLEDALGGFGLDLWETQPFNVYIAVEKDALVRQLESWFLDRGLRVFACRGYHSVDLEQRLQDTFDARPSVCIYGGDYDPSGSDIARHLEEKVGFDEFRHVALTGEQVVSEGLPPAVGKASDSRAPAFLEREGQLVQVELDALPPDRLRELYEDALADYFDKPLYERARAAERRERGRAQELVARLR